MIEYHCDECGKKISSSGIEKILEKCTNHLCVDCAVKRIKECAKKIAESNKLRYAPYDALLFIYDNIAHTSMEVNCIRSPYEPRCPVCGEDMMMKNPVQYTYFCEKCMAVYDRYGKKIEDVKL